MNLLEKIEDSYKYICNNLKYVKINYEEIDKIIDEINKKQINYWLDSNPFNILDMELDDILLFLVIYHTIGDYCFWGDPKWEINTEDGKMDGSYAMMYLLINRFKNNKDFNIDYNAFKELLKGNVEVPLLEDRYNNLVEMNKVIKNNKNFIQTIKIKKNDIDLLEYIVKKFKYFKDETIYKGKKVYFYKRAQLLVSDILHIIKEKTGENTNYSNLIGCADYKIPQVMRCYGMIEYCKELEYRIDNKELILKDSEEEIEIRACDLEIINYIYEKTNKKYTRMDINDYIWLLGQDKRKNNKPYHRTLTNNY